MNHTKMFQGEGKGKNKIILNVLILLHFAGMLQTVSSQVVPQDSLALVALWDNTDGSNWTNHSGWMEGPVSTWQGVTVSANRVTKINLSTNNLNGIIPQQIGDLTELTEIDLHTNGLSGSIPEEFYNLIHLERVQLETNQLDGLISSNIGNLVNLISLNFNDNLLTGAIPAEIGNLVGLEELRLRYNQLSGTIPLGMYSLTKLRTVNLSVNQLEGTIPPQIGNLVDLTEFSVPYNNMHGIIPDDIGNLINLKFLWLNDNEFEGVVPAGIGDMALLFYLRLENNHFTSLPDISNSTFLTSTHIQNNRFTFEDIEPNIAVGGFVYSPQDSLGDNQDVVIDKNASYQLAVTVGGTANEYQWMKDGVVIPGATDSTYTINNASADATGSYLCQVSNTIATDLQLFSRPTQVTVLIAESVEDHSPRFIQSPGLFQNYPNPFSLSTNIKYQIRHTNFVELIVFNIEGQTVRILVSEQQTAGTHICTWDAGSLPGGTYFYRLTTGNFSAIGKLFLLR